ncbi:MAG TPA: 5'/3'-nucleotidase SurE [Gemmatimonadaceae bacterium]|nr:5'/3'-nucleotidase SurE [Gemmatimonadaceae bacterium]
MRFLLTNDDGILAHGLDVLERATRPLGDVWVVAPDREQSATSHSLTVHHPLRPVQHDERRWQVDGTPTDCVLLAVEALLPERPDFVLSGVNHGQNLGEDVLYSGTVAAAMEGLACGVPSIAFSFAGGVLRSNKSMLDQQVDLITQLLRHFTSAAPFPPGTLLNVNLPPATGAEVRGARLTRLGRRVFSQSLRSLEDPWGRKMYWIGGGSATWDDSIENSDIKAIQEKFVSVTPLHLDLTHATAIDQADAWWRPL